MHDRGIARRHRRNLMLPLMLLSVFAIAGGAFAAPLNLVKKFPDLTSGFIKVTYDGAGAFVAGGTSTAFDLDGVPPPDHNISAGGTPSKRWELNMTLTPATGALVSGTLNVTGTIPALGANSGTLLTANLSAFGFPTGGGRIFEWLFTITGGDLAPQYGGLNRTGGIILDATPGTGAVAFTGSFTQAFQNTTGTVGGGSADSFFVPEPASTGLLLISGFTLMQGALVHGRRSARRESR